MAILIKDMDMPTRCCECRLSTCHSFKERPLCDVLVEYMSYGEWEAKRLDNCPLVPVQPHGRLIDADALVRELNSIRASFGSANGLVEGALNIAVSTVNGRPTIIPSEEGE